MQCSAVHAYTKTVPRALDVSLDPFLNGLDIRAAILQLLPDARLVAVQDVDAGRLVGRGVEHAPAAVLQAGAQVPGERVAVRRLEVHVVGARARVVLEERVHRLHLARVRVHAARRLPRLDVAPNHGRHVPLVVHEARVEVGRLVRIRRLDVYEAARERILQEMEHGEEISGRPVGGSVDGRSFGRDGDGNSHEHMVAEPAGNDGIMHHGLVGLVLEVRLPALGEVGSRPGFEFLELRLVRSNLDPGVDSVSRKWPCPLQVPLVEHLCFCG